MKHKLVHPLDLLANPSADLCVLDVRTAPEVAAVALPGALHIPLHELTPERFQNDLEKHGTQGSRVDLLCQRGKGAETAADQLLRRVDSALCIIAGGMSAIRQARSDVARGDR